MNSRNKYNITCMKYFKQYLILRVLITPILFILMCKDKDISQFLS